MAFGITKLAGFLASVVLLHGASACASPTYMGVKELTARCAPAADNRTMMFLIQNESKAFTYALNINGNFRLARQPRDEREAIGFARWLLARGFSFDVGLMQVNSANFSKVGLSLNDLFEPCHNIKAGYAVLSDCYHRALLEDNREQVALRKALSCYNTGSFTSGFRNGYVQKVVAIAQNSTGEDVQVLIPELIPDKPRKKQVSVSSSPSPVSVQHENADNGAFGSDGSGENDQFEEQETAAKQPSGTIEGKQSGDAERISGSSSNVGGIGKGKGGV